MLVVWYWVLAAVVAIMAAAVGWQLLRCRSKDALLSQPSVICRDPPRAVFVAERGCRPESVRKAADAFEEYMRAAGLPVVVTAASHHIEDPTAVIVRVMEGQEQHGRHQLIVPRSEREVHVELASYAYNSAPTRHVIKFEGNVVFPSHALSQAAFDNVRSMLDLSCASTPLRYTQA